MAAVDLRFDQAEVWLFRNTFTIPRNLIPYVLFLHHPQEGFGPYMQKGADEELMKELEVTIAKVNSQREEIAILDLVHERQFRRVQALKEVKSKLSQLLAGGGARGQLIPRATLPKALLIRYRYPQIPCQLPPRVSPSSYPALWQNAADYYRLPLLPPLLHLQRQMLHPMVKHSLGVSPEKPTSLGESNIASKMSLQAKIKTEMMTCVL